MQDGRVFTDYLHRAAHSDPSGGSFRLKEGMKREGERIRRDDFERAAASAQAGRCQAPPVPPPSDVQTCDARVCAFARVDEPYTLGLETRSS
jgi:hypothetical protein